MLSPKSKICCHTAPPFQVSQNSNVRSVRLVMKLAGNCTQELLPSNTTAPLAQTALLIRMPWAVPTESEASEVKLYRWSKFGAGGKITWTLRMLDMAPTIAVTLAFVVTEPIAVSSPCVVIFKADELLTW